VGEQCKHYSIGCNQNKKPHKLLQIQFHTCAYEQLIKHGDVLLVLFLLADTMALVNAMTACPNPSTNSHREQNLNIFCEETKGCLRRCGLFSIFNGQHPSFL